MSTQSFSKYPINGATQKELNMGGFQEDLKGNSNFETWPNDLK
jgi:hypothetical protein